MEEVMEKKVADFWWSLGSILLMGALWVLPVWWMSDLSFKVLFGPISMVAMPMALFASELDTPPVLDRLGTLLFSGAFGWPLVAPFILEAA